jgi:hypothetical protein
MMPTTLHLKSQTTVLADGRLLGDCVQLNVFHRMTKRTSATITNCYMTRNFNDRHFVD